MISLSATRCASCRRSLLRANAGRCRGSTVRGWRLTGRPCWTRGASWMRAWPRDGPSRSPDRPQPVIELAGQEGSLCCWPPTVQGMSTVMQHLRLAEPASTEVTLPGLDRPGSVMSCSRPVARAGLSTLDALDHCGTPSSGSVSIVLQDCLTRPQAAGVPWRLACRPAVWDGELAAALSSRLSRVHAAEAAAAHPRSRCGRRVRSDPACPDDVSFDALVRAGLGGLATSPMRLQSASRQWKDGNGHLPDSQLGAIRSIERLLR